MGAPQDAEGGLKRHREGDGKERRLETGRQSALQRSESTPHRVAKEKSGSLRVVVPKDDQAQSGLDGAAPQCGGDVLRFTLRQESTEEDAAGGLFDGEGD
jgi:hypothetical protein